MDKVSLNGEWEIRREGSLNWQPIRVPGCWEANGFPKDDAGPYEYRKKFTVPPEFSGRGVWLRFDGVSYHCKVFINGQEAGSHTGTWDRFKVEATGRLQPGQEAELLLRVEKPASLTNGPDSETNPGRFPLRQTLSSFLPYVWGHAFGGVWQSVWLEASGAQVLEDILIQGSPDGQVRVQAVCSERCVVRLEIDNPQGETTWQGEARAGRQRRSKSRRSSSRTRVEFKLRLLEPQAWTLEKPELYTARLETTDAGGVKTTENVRFGLRKFESRGRSFLLNGQPVYPRMVLSWGWYPDLLCPAPTPERTRADLLRLKAMGYNGVKLCLWFPPQYYFELADELGMLLWLELPLWLPVPQAGFYEQALREYEQMVCQARGHVSLVMYTLGCELSRSIEASFLEKLYHRVKELVPGAVVRDNSGSGEAYGGWLDEWADFYDHHFYCDLQFLRPLLAEFSPAWREPKPWVMGEFCDYDTLRNLPALLEQAEGSPAWWTSDDPKVNPQGARWEQRLPGHARLLRQNGLWKHLEELRLASYRQGLLQRKVTLETVRLDPNLSGYVVTGERDTPISTAGMWDDLGQLKFSAEEFLLFNQDTVLLLGWERRRSWTAGGDRVSPRERWNYTEGATFRATLVCSHFNPEHGQARLGWSAAFPGEAPFAGEESKTRSLLSPGQVQPMAVIQFQTPHVEKPQRASLHAWLDSAEHHSENRWPIWIYPANPWKGVQPFALYDPQGKLADLEALRPPLVQGRLQPGTHAVCTSWTAEVESFLNGGGQAILTLQGGQAASPVKVVEVPFWREALRLVEPQPGWGDFPHENEPGLQFYSLATDCAMELSKSEHPYRPLLRRLDTRGMTLLDYAAVMDWGKGQLLATTLRLQGGLGDQPAGISRNPAAVHLLAEWVKFSG